MAGVSDVVRSTERRSRRENAHPRGGNSRDLSDAAGLLRDKFARKSRFLSSPVPALEARPSACPGTSLRPRVRGKFIFVGEEKLYVRGVTYGPFRPGQDGTEYPGPARVAQDFEAIAGTGSKTV